MPRKKPRFTVDPPPYDSDMAAFANWAYTQLQRVEDWWPKDYGDRVSALEALQGELTGEWSVSGESSVRFEGVISEEGGCTITSLTSVQSWTAASIGGLPGQFTSFALSEDGTVMFLHSTSGERIYQYGLTDGDPSTLTSSGHNLDLTAFTSSQRPMAVSPQGDWIYVPGDGSGTPRYSIYGYELTTPWDITTATYRGAVSFEAYFTPGNAVGAAGVTTDGSQLFLPVSNTTNVIVWDMSSPFDITTASYNSTVSLTNLPSGLSNWAIDSTGETLYALNGGTAMQRYTLTTPNDVTTAVNESSITFTSVLSVLDLHFDLLSCETILTLESPIGNEAFRRWSVS